MDNSVINDNSDLHAGNKRLQKETFTEVTVDGLETTKRRNLTRDGVCCGIWFTRFSGGIVEDKIE